MKESTLGLIFQFGLLIVGIFTVVIAIVNLALK